MFPQNPYQLQLLTFTSVSWHLLPPNAVFNISHSVSKLEFVHCYQLGTDAPERTYLKVGGLL